MTSKIHPEITIKGARTNNLKNISLRIPHRKLIVVTGISGSGKSSLAFEIIAKEGQRRYFETLPTFARQFIGKLNRPDIDSIEGLSPVIAIDQHTQGKHARSTVGTLTDIYDLLRLLFARTGKTDINVELSRALFSFNSEIGKCKQCQGIGKQEKIDLNHLILFPDKSIRNGVLASTLPNGYIMYSQVTIDVLNQVCEAEGFSVDIPWNELTDSQKKVILYGSEKVKVPFGKHSLESRLKWTGIKAKPREEGYYKGMIPIMSDILRRDRNANILKYVHSVTCPLCNGARLNKDALSVLVHGKSIDQVVKFELNELNTWIQSESWGTVEKEIINKIQAQIDLLEDLGLGHLSLNRTSQSLRSSEIQRIRVANQLLVPLSDVLYIFDEPSIGLHPEENLRMIGHFKQLVNKGNTVIIVEHNLDTITSADHILEIGPKAGICGGEVVFNGPYLDFIKSDKLHSTSPTYRAIKKSTSELAISSEAKNLHAKDHLEKQSKSIRLFGCQERNLKNIDVEFKIGQLNVVSGKSGVGKSSLVKETLLKIVQKQLGRKVHKIAKISYQENIESINKLIFIDHSPIGKTPRSNPATYLGISDHIRDLYASLPLSKAQGFTKSRFSFNNKGGRCETCLGAGKTQIGMHFLGNIDLVCGTCNGDRFNEKTLQVTYNGLSIADIYKLSVDQAISLFKDQKKILVGLSILQDIGLGYLTLGQSSTTLSGGEAQRIKIANQLQKKDTGDTLYVIIEPSIGLHYDDIESLLSLFDRIKQKGNTIVCIEQNSAVIQSSDWHIELGPKSGSKGGHIAYQGIPRAGCFDSAQQPFSVSGHKNVDLEQMDKLMTSDLKKIDVQQTSEPKKKAGKNVISEVFHNKIVLNGVTTHGLKNIDVQIPKNQLTVVTGVSGSGKSSLVYDTLFAESNARFTESLSTYNRSFNKQNSEAKITYFTGLGPAIGINRKGGSPSTRSTVGTLSSVYDAFRLLYSRIAQHQGIRYTAQHFSFNHHLGSCPACEGLGIKRQCDPNKLIISPEKTIFNGAIGKSKPIDYYADINGQFIAILMKVAQENHWNIDRPWQQLEQEIQNVILYGTGDLVWNATWKFTTKSREGTQSIKAKWLGLCNYINDEYRRKINNKNIKKLEELLHDVICPICNGSRLKPELLNTKFLNKNIHELSQMTISSCLELIESRGIKGTKTDYKIDPVVLSISNVVLPTVTNSLKTIVDLGLDYLNLNRSVSTLSGGERQRLILASQLSSHLFGVTYVLDEPTIGLDKGQVAVLTKVIKDIVANGNTAVVIEHDSAFIKNADYLVEMGPGAGNLGGEVVYQGKLCDLVKAKHTVSYKLLHHRFIPSKRKPSKKRSPFGVKSAFANNLKNIDIDFTAEQIIAIKGVSGSGKSSLIKDVLYNSWLNGHPVNCSSVHGLNQFEQILLIDQEVLSQNRLSTPSSYTGILDQIKALFVKTEYAKEAKLKKVDFSYQSKKGKCLSCGGHGKLKTSMDFMSDIWLTCDFCNGMRYNEEILACQYNSHSIGEILCMTVNEAIDFFKGESIVNELEVLVRLGVGHIVLGQSVNTLSGGESQRLKLAYSILQKRKGSTLFLFDEPSTGLHYFDILKLINVFQSMIDGGDTVLFIEHNSTLIESADQVITLGPGSGEKGGEILKT